MPWKRPADHRRHGNSRRGTGFESLESRILLAGDPILSGQALLISEFVAANNTSLLTRTRTSALDPFEGDPISPDWIELMNVSDQRLDLGGMHLTDDALEPMKWEFPVGASIDAGAFLVVFASGDDIRDPSLDEHGFLHTNFRLSNDGEYLALTGSDGAVVHEFAPSYPTQQTDVSYSVHMDVRRFLGSGASLEYLVPTDDSLEPQWRLPGFSHPNLITGVATKSPIGFDRGGGPVEPGETIGAELIARASMDFSQGSIVVLESRPFTTAGRVSEWSFYSETTLSITPLVLRSRSGGFDIVGVGRTRASDGSGAQSFAFDVQSGNDSVESTGYFFGFKDGDNQVNELGVVGRSPSASDRVRRYNGPQSGNVVAGKQLPAGRVEDWTYSIQATTQARLAGPFNTNVASAMTGATSLYVRYPFTAGSLDTLQSLLLRVRYEDGVVAYLNGTEVARRNVPEAVHFDSTAVSNRLLVDANRLEEINISQFMGALVAGQNVLALHMLNESSGSPELLLDARLVAIDVPSASDVGFATAPTPGLANSAIIEDIASAPLFSHSRGFYEEPFTLELTTPETPGAAIYFTTDGSEPAPGNARATLYQQPLEIGGTTILRAASYLDGQLPSLPQTHTYIFPSDVVMQSGLQPAVTEDPVWGPQLMDALLALPTISLVTPDAISEIEVPTSAELIFPNGTDGFQVDAGLETWGGVSIGFPKRSLRLSFKNIYGPATLNYDLFEDPDGVTEFDQILLKSGAHDSLFFGIGPPGTAFGNANYLRNRWATDRQQEMGQPAARSRYMHLYINGTYWGMYDMSERPNAAFMASRFGGDAEDYDALNAGVPVDGDNVAWNALIDAVDDGYDAVQNYLDVENYADYVLLQWYAGNTIDWWPDRNWMAARRRESGAEFQFFVWDSDYMLRLGAGNIVNLGGPSNLWIVNGGVQQYPEFLRLLADRAQKYFYDGGMFTDERLRADIDALAQEVRLPIIAETARWSTGMYTPDTWEAEIDWVKETFAPEGIASRAALVIEQMREIGAFPQPETPQFIVDSQRLQGNQVPPGAELSMTAPEGVIYYTLDGSDPWDEIPTVEYTTFVSEYTTVHALVPSDDTLHMDWLAPAFDDSNWISGENGVGFDTTGIYTPLIRLNIQQQMKDFNSTAYVRIPFQVDDPSQFDSLQLSMRYNDGFVAYLNGVEVARRNAPAALTWNTGASAARRVKEDAIEFEKFNLSRLKHLLQPGDNVLAVHALNAGPSNVDLLITPLLKAGKVTDTGVSQAAILFSDPITVPPGVRINARTVWGDQWSPPREANAILQLFPLRISEVMFHPADPTTAEQAAGFTDQDDFEFIELVNISHASIDLADVRFVETTDGGQTEGVQFDFGQGTIQQLAPGQRILVVENLTAFQARYGTNLPVAGSWSGGLSNGGEQITLVADGETLQQFRYQDDWYSDADGDGYSLEILNERSDELSLWGEASGWLPSIAWGGTPGASRSTAEVHAGDLNLDGVTDEADLAGLLLGLNDPDQYVSRYGVSAALAGDTDGDGDLDFDDIPGFVLLISGEGELSSPAAASAVEPRRTERRLLKHPDDNTLAETVEADKATESSWADRVDRAFGQKD